MESLAHRLLHVVHDRHALVAVAAAVLLATSLPRGRRRLGIWPLVLLALAGLTYAIGRLLPNDGLDPDEPLLIARFFLGSSLLISVLRIGAVSIWERIQPPLPRIVLDVSGVVLIGVALVTTLYEAGIEAGNLFTGSAVVTAVMGFALKDTLGNVFAGLTIHAEHPFEVGDWIQYDAVTAHIGKVVEINWRATKVITLDEAYVIIPNGQLAQASIRNFTKPEPWSRRSLFVVTPYDVPPQRVQAIILEALAGSFGVLASPPPSVVTNAFTERGVEHWVRLFTTAFDKRDRVDGMARDRIWYALARHGIRIPVATHAVQLTEPPAPEPPEQALARRVMCLEGVAILEPLLPDYVRGVATAATERSYGAGEQVVRQGALGTSMFVVLSGRLSVTARDDASGTQALLATLVAGDSFGEMSLLTGAPRMATVTTLEETRLLEVGKDAFTTILETHPELIESLGARLQRQQSERSRLLADREARQPETQDLFRRIRDYFNT